MIEPEGRELRAAIAFARRQAWLILGLPLAVGLLALAGRRPEPLAYQTRLAFALDIPRSALLPGSDEGTAAKIGESLVDDMARLVGHDQFAAAVARRLAGTGLAPGQISGALSGEDKHRILELTIRAELPADADEDARRAMAASLLATAGAVEAELEENGDAWFARLGEDAVALSLIDAPEAPGAPEPASLRRRLDLPLRLLLGLLAGLGLAFLRQALDRRIHDVADAEAALGAPVIGRIPRP